MSAGITDPKLSKDVAAMWNAPDAATAQAAAKQLAADAEADLSTADPKDTDGIATLNSLISYGNSYQFNPQSAHFVPMDSKQLSKALRFAIDLAGPDVSALLADYMALLTKLREQGSQVSATQMGKELAFALIEYKDDGDSATSQLAASDTTAIGQEIGGGIALASAGVETFFSVKSYFKSKAAETLQGGEVETKTTTKLESDEKLESKKLKYEEAQSEQQLAKTGPDQDKANEVTKDARNKFAAASRQNRLDTRNLEKAQTKVTSLRGSAETWNNAGRIAGAFGQGFSTVIEGVAGHIAANYQYASAQSAAESKLYDNFKDLVKQFGDGQEKWADGLKGNLDNTHSTYDQIAQLRHEARSSYNSHIG